MGRRGPMPKPLALALLTGSKRGRRRAKHAPKPDLTTPEQPQWATEEARLCWEHNSAMLGAMGLLSRTDQALLVRYCQTWGRWVEAEKFLAQRGATYPLRDESGKVRCLQQWPQVSIANKLSQQLLRMEQDMGLTPAARARLGELQKGHPESCDSALEDEFFNTPPTMRITE